MKKQCNHTLEVRIEEDKTYKRELSGFMKSTCPYCNTSTIVEMSMLAQYPHIYPVVSLVYKSTKKGMD